MQRYFLSTKGYLCILAALAIFAIGCGGSGGSSESRLTKAEFVKRVEAICLTGQREGGKKLVALLSKEDKAYAGGRLTDAFANEIIDSVIAPVYQREAANIDALNPPASDDDEVASIVEMLRTGLEQAKQDPQKALSTNEIVPEASTLAKKYGLRICGVVWT